MGRTIGDNIRKLRIERNLTQKQLGELLGVSAQMIGQYETGVRNPRYPTIKRIAAALGVLVQDITNYVEPEHQDRAADSILYSWLDIEGYTQGSPGTEVEDDVFFQFVKCIAFAGNQLNQKGLEAAVERVGELTYIPAYQKEKD